MKNRITGFGRSSIAVLVLLCMLFSIFAPAVMAADNAAQNLGAQNEESAYPTFDASIIANISSEDMCAILGTVIATLEKPEYAEIAPDLTKVAEIKAALENGDEISDDEIFEAVKDTVKEIVNNEDIDELAATDMVKDVAGQILASEEISSEAKVVITEQVVDAVGGVAGDALPVLPALSGLFNIFDVLKADGFMTDDQVTQIISMLYAVLLSGEEITVEAIFEVVIYTYDVVFAGALGIEDKILLAGAIYGAVKDEYGFTEQDIINKVGEYLDNAFDYVENIVSQEGFIEAAIGKLDAALAEIKAAVYEAVDFAIAGFNEAIDNADVGVAEIKALVDELKAEISDLLAEVDNIADAVKSLACAMIDFIGAVKIGSKEEVEKAVAKINEAITGIQLAAQDAEKLISYVMVITDKIAGKLQSVKDELAAASGALDNESDSGLVIEPAAFVENTDDINNEIVELLENVKALANKALVIVIDALESKDSFVALVDKVIEKLGALANKIKTMYENALKAEYNIDADSYYVALGDVTTKGDAKSYASILADKLGIKFSDLTDEGLGFTLEEAVKVIDTNKAILEKADLITINYSKSAAYADIDLNWKDAFGDTLGSEIEELVEYITAGIEDSITKLVASTPLDGNAEEVIKMAKTYAYAQAARMVTIHQLVNELHEIAPDALVVIVGAYNEFDGVSFEVAGETINLGEYFAVLTEIGNASSFAASFFNDNTIFVSTSGVETVIKASGGKIDLNNISDTVDLFDIPSNFVPSAKGNQDIANRIIDAIIGDHDHEYSYACDPVCDICGAMRDVFNLHTYDNVCDEKCNVCGFVRFEKDSKHVYSADCDKYCDNCGKERSDAIPHSFTAWKVESQSTYNVMGMESRECTNEGCDVKETRMLPILIAPADDGTSVGLIIGITIPSILVLAAGGFSAYWFVYKKKTFKDLKDVFAKFLASFKK